MLARMETRVIADIYLYMYCVAMRSLKRCMTKHMAMHSRCVLQMASLEYLQCVEG